MDDSTLGGTPDATSATYTLNVGDVNPETVTGTPNNDIIFGGSGNDTLGGSDGVDTLTGGLGKDTMTGGSGADHFIFNLKTESAKGANRDVILDFSGSGLGGEHDQIDLTGIDAKKGHGNQAFHFIGAHKFHHKVGELHFVKHGTFVTVEGDIDGNGKADFQIDVHNLTNDLNSLALGDFIR